MSTHSDALANVPLYIDDTPGMSVPMLRARARRLARRHGGMALIVIDYLQLMTAPGGRRPENRVQELSEITRGLKMLAKELDVPVIALSQLSRGVESRDDKRPQLSDLRESGSIEQDADIVMFTYREEYYLEGRDPSQKISGHNLENRSENWGQRLDKARGKGDLIIGKNRHGKTETIRLKFEGEYSRFVDDNDFSSRAAAPDHAFRAPSASYAAPADLSDVSDEALE
jgi:replicative DNA helicase